MVQVDQLIGIFQQMYKEHWSYVWGKAEKGCVDCSGSFTYAFRQFGLSIPHGSNAIARRFIIGKMLPISEAKPGMAAFKSKLPGEEGYDLPDKYKSGSDLTDYYHIGLVDDDPAYVLNAKGKDSGFCRDKLTRKNGWDCVAYLRDVDYGEEAQKMPETYVEATVVLPQGASGSTVNLRSGPGKGEAVVAKVPVGTHVAVAEDLGAWCKIYWDGKNGWMMSNYLEFAGQGGEESAITEEQLAQISSSLKAIEHATEAIWAVIGRG